MTSSNKFNHQVVFNQYKLFDRCSPIPERVYDITSYKVWVQVRQEVFDEVFFPIRDQIIDNVKAHTREINANT